MTSSSLTQDLLDRQVSTLIGTVWNPNGLLLAKTVPTQRADAFVETGLGASPTWHGFTIDQGGIAVTKAISPVGDLRLRIDPDAVRVIGDGFAWGPARFVTQEGGPVAECGRGALARIEESLQQQGISALVGHELEFQLAAADGSPLPTTGWAPYSLAGVLQHEDFVRELYRMAAVAGLQIQQLHAEYAMRQFEFCLEPQSPVAAADSLALARLVVQRAAHATGLGVSFSPKPYATDAGNGAHQHFSLSRNGTPLFSDGTGPHGLTDDGAAAVGRVVELLPELQAVFAGSILSATRMAPGTWAGAHAAWGLENREVAVRLIAATPSNPLGAHVEVKIIDPSSSGYIASAGVLAAMLDGITRATTLPAEATCDPGAMTEQERAAAGITVLTDDHRTALDRLDASTAVRGLIGDGLVDAIVAGRRHEADNYGDLSPEALTERFRFAWSL
ncbi:type I glutamate--ammonia ligase [Microlunatus soli]|uniref:L-glutamine synthetase n=1 Tax=Microlunatus soli TaxID=630515 RepID=A0A1H1U212_9ACTN|nr:glutamine synthetase family protein [Microlunatus soli]SDS66507.1 L-glutamine synthetase [Microlunatus soli]